MRKLALVVIFCAAPAFAAPVEIRNESGTFDHWREACAMWIEPEGDKYRWTFLCAGEKDPSEQGQAFAWADVYSTLCEGDGTHGLPPAVREVTPDPGTSCADGSGIYGQVGLDQVAVDIEGGTASVNAEVQGCRLDLDWAATGAAETSSGSFLVWGYSIGLYPGAWLWKVDVTTTERPASMRGDICPQASISGPPDDTWIREVDMTYQAVEVQWTHSEG